MADETTVTTDASGTSATAAGPGVSITTESAPKSFNEYVLFKLDRSLAILGIIGIAIVSIVCYGNDMGVQIANVAVGGLVGYVGGRTGK